MRKRIFGLLWSPHDNKLKQTGVQEICKTRPDWLKQVYADLNEGDMHDRITYVKKLTGMRKNRKKRACEAAEHLCGRMQEKEFVNLRTRSVLRTPLSVVS